MKRPPPKRSGLTVHAIEAWLVAQVAKRLDLMPKAIDPTAALGDFGLDSVDAIGLVGDTERYLGRPLDATLAYEYPTVRQLAKFLATPPSRNPAARVSDRTTRKTTARKISR